MDASARHYTHHAACGCTFDQEDAPVTPCPEATRLVERRRAAMAGGTDDDVRAADAAYHEHLATALADAKA
jgi:hypothetical protein